MSIIESQEPAYREEHEIDVLTKRIAELERELAAARNANTCVDAMASAMEDAKSMQQLVWTMEREAREASERIGQLESLVRDVYEAVDRYGGHMDAKYLDGMCELCHADNGGKSPCASTAEDLSASHCVPYTTLYFEKRMAALGLLEGDGE